MFKFWNRRSWEVTGGPYPSKRAVHPVNVVCIYFSIVSAVPNPIMMRCIFCCRYMKHAIRLHCWICYGCMYIQHIHTYIPDVHAWNSSSSSIVPLLPNSLIKFAASALQCVTIENQQSPFYVVNRVTLAGEKSYHKILLVPWIDNIYVKKI